MNAFRFSIKNALGSISVSLLVGCAGGHDISDAVPNILWINLDDGRADAVGCYGSSWANTPNIDRLAEEGVRFHHAIVQNPVCVPSRNSMKTGYYAHQAGPVEMGRAPDVQGDYIDHQRMKEINESSSLLDIWAAAGRKPVNVGKIHARHDGFDNRGDAPILITHGGEPMQYFKDNIGDVDPLFLNSLTAKTRKYGWLIGGLLNVKPQQTETWRLGDMAVDVLKELKQKDEPFFMRVSFHAPHVACYVPEEYYIDPATIHLALPTTEELALKPAFERGPVNIYCGADLSPEQIGLARGTYYGMVSLVDVQVGRIMKFLEEEGLMENTIVAFTSDQGFQLGEHGIWKKRVFYEGNVRTPFILRYPKILPENKTIEEPVEMVDFLPTLIELSGFEFPSNIRGRSLLPLVDGRVKEWREATFSEIDHSQSMYEELRQGSGRRVMVRTKEWKMIFFMDSRVADKDGALYNLKADPDERINLYNNPQYAEVIARMEKLAKRWDSGENLFVEK